MSESYKVPRSYRDITVAPMANRPAVGRVVKSILVENSNESSQSRPRRAEDVAKDAAIQNFKLWCDGF